jgi:serine/threonine protein kinase
MQCPRCNVGDISATDNYCIHCGFTLVKGGKPNTPVPPDLEERIRGVLSPQYRIEGMLGRGGMSLVYLAREVDLNRFVAMKVLPLQLSHGTDAAERFKREAKIAASLDHPHIVPIHRIGATSTFLWFTMKFVAGRSLVEQVQENGPMGRLETFKIIEQVASALHYAHERGVVHRDVKPANVMVDDDGCAMVCDFGVAKGFGAADSVSLTQSGGTMGTPTYMSPEQLYGQPLDGRADQYSLAILIFECLAGRPPFIADSMGEILRMHCLEPPPRLSEFRPDLPLRVSQGLARAMSKKPDQRYANVLDFVVAIGGRRPVGVIRRGDEDTQPTLLRIPHGWIPMPKFLRIPEVMHFAENRVFKHLRWTGRMLLRFWAWLVPQLRKLSVLTWRGTKRFARGTWRVTKWLAPRIVRLPLLLRPSEMKRLPAVLKRQAGVAAVGLRNLPRRAIRKVSLRVAIPATAAAVLFSAISIKLVSQDSLEPEPHSLGSWDAVTTLDMQSALAGGDLALAAVTDSVETVPDSVAVEPDTVVVAEPEPAPPPRPARPRNTTRRPTPVATPVVTQPEPEPPTRDHRAEVGQVIERFVDAVESRNVTQLRRVYPNLTPQDQESWEGFFQIADQLEMTVNVTDLAVNGSEAEAMLESRYDYLLDGEPESFTAQLFVLFDLAADAWGVSLVRNRSGGD